MRSREAFFLRLVLSDRVPYVRLVEERAGDEERIETLMWMNLGKLSGNLYAPRVRNHIMEVHVQTCIIASAARRDGRAAARVW